MGIVTAGRENSRTFTEIAATAMDTFRKCQELSALADEQAALRRVAELIARGAPLDRVFQAVTAETATLLGSHSSLRRQEHDGTMTTLATYDAGHATTLTTGTELTAPVVVAGRTWGALTTSIPGSLLPPHGEADLQKFAGLAAAAITNAEKKAHLTASRARVVATADEARRRLQRDVHDGAQQRLVQTIITLKIAQAAIARGETPSREVAEALRHAERANAELRDVVHGILPASLTRGGLRTGLESLVSDFSIPVDLRLTVPRLPGQIETTVYFFVAEALTNVVKHAQATYAGVTVETDGATVWAEVRDDGIGGADPAGGSGLTGLSDRIQAVDGTLRWTSAAGRGTVLRASLPLGVLPASSRP
jgi:signal transduction histidine kinase